MTTAIRISHSGRLRLPLALGVAGLMITGSAAMAWPALKTAFAPLSAPAVTADAAPTDPAAVTDFVEMTRAQMAVVATPALADPADLPTLTLAHAPNLMLDASILRKPRAAPDLLVMPQVELPASAPAEMQVPAQMAQAQLAPPAPRPAEVLILPVTDADRAAVNAPAPRALRTTPQIVPVSTHTAPPPPATGQTRERLLNMWMTGAYR